MCQKENDAQSPSTAERKLPPRHFLSLAYLKSYIINTRDESKNETFNQKGRYKI
jgi:hypothetical protein